MTRRQIVEELAEQQVVEQLVRIICKVSATYLQDLSQMIYVYLLEYDEQRLITLYEEGSLRFFLVRIIKNQWHSNTSPFHYTYRKFQHLSNELTDYEDEDTQGLF